MLSVTVNTDKQNLPWGGEHVNALAASASLCSHSCKLKFGAHSKNFVTLMFLMIIFLYDCTCLHLCKWAHEEK
jgi:acetolactate synthase regulatory subunit